MIVHLDTDFLVYGPGNGGIRANTHVHDAQAMGRETK